MDWEQRCKELQQRVEELERENQELRRKLGCSEPVHPVVTESFKTEVMQEPSAGAGVHMRSTPEEKIRLFRSLFRGREDVFARRWYSVQKEKGGYAPVCANEWKYGICIKPKGKCSKCENRVLVPLDDSIIYKHLSGKDANGQDVIGLYPILADDTCYFLAIDFDDGAWQENASAVRRVCGEWGIPCGVERSRSGEGAHLWVFFEDAIPCGTARKLGSALLTAAMEREGKLKLDAYDRMFPCQDTLPSGGFGNLIALPLQGQARKKGNSLFVDEMFQPYPDQWAYLSTMRKLGLEDVDALIRTHSHGDALGNLCVVESTSKPWERHKKVALSALDFYGVQHIVPANMIYIPATGFAPRVRNQLLRLAAFRNPDFYKSQAMRLPIYDKPRIICAAEERDGYLALPRCCEPDLTELLETAGASYEVEDKTFSGNEIQATFKGELRPEQIPAAETLLAYNNGVLSATTAFGKTVIAAYLIGRRKVNTLVLVHTQALLNQWKKALSEFLEINEPLPELPKKRGRKKERSLIGQLGGSKNNLAGFVDIAIMQSLISGDEVRELVKDYGMVIVDECHHVSAVSFEQVLKEVNAKFVYGLTATPTRQDGHQPIIHMQCGPIRYQVDAKAQAEKRPFDHAVIPKFTSFAQPVTDEVPWKITDAYAAMQEVLIYDYVDIRVPMLERMYHKRLSGYAAIGYTIRGDRTAPSAENRIFSQEEYWDTFSVDIANAEREILVSSPYLHIAQVKRFLKLIPEDIHVTVMTGDETCYKPETWAKESKAVKLLEDNGAKVILQPKVYQRDAVIDKRILWYGGINFLGFEKAAHGAMRLCSAELAGELTSHMNTPNKYEQLEMY